MQGASSKGSRQELANFPAQNIGGLCVTEKAASTAAVRGALLKIALVNEGLACMHVRLLDEAYVTEIVTAIFRVEIVQGEVRTVSGRAAPAAPVRHGT